MFLGISFEAQVATDYICDYSYYNIHNFHAVYQARSQHWARLDLDMTIQEWVFSKHEAHPLSSNAIQFLEAAEM